MPSHFLRLSHKSEIAANSSSKLLASSAFLMGQLMITSRQAGWLAGWLALACKKWGQAGMINVCKMTGFQNLLLLLLFFASLMIRRLST
jgi:hypothetical protein